MIANGKPELRKFVAPEMVFGEGALSLIGQYAANFGARKVLLVTDPGVRASGWAGAVEKALKEAMITYVVFDGVTPNPKDHEAMAGAEVYLSEKCDVIVVVGGGSPTDCAKAIGIIATNDRHILELEGMDEVVVPGPPLICITTTAGSSADVSQFAIITDTARQMKITIISKTLVPDVALIDPETSVTMPSELTAATGMDALVHAIEAYVSNASLGLVHSMSHALGGWLDLAHGDCNAILLEHVVRFNFASAAERYRGVGMAMEPDMEEPPADEEKLVEALGRFRRRVGIQQTLGGLGVMPADLPEMARKAFHDPCLATNPVQPTVHEIEVIYEQALRGS